MSILKVDELISSTGKINIPSGEILDLSECKSFILPKGILTTPEQFSGGSIKLNNENNFVGYQKKWENFITERYENYTKSGLILNIDATKKASYDGGNIAYDLTGRTSSSNGTLSSGVFHDGDKFDFNGSDGSIDGSVGSLPASWSIEYLGKFRLDSQTNYEYFGSVGTSGSAGSMISVSRLGNRSVSDGYNSADLIGYMYMYNGVGNPIIVDAFLGSTKWYHVVVNVYPESPFIEVYVDGDKKDLITAFSTPFQTSNGTYRIGGWSGGTWWLNGFISCHRIYGKSLNFDEVQQNLNSFKTLFDI